MKILTNNNSVAFGTNIKFVSPNDFGKVKHFFTEKHLCPETTSFVMDSKNSNSTHCCYRIEKDKNYTQKIRCGTGLVVADTERGTTGIFAHLFPNPRNYKTLPLIGSQIKGTNAILIGSKPKIAFSSTMFEGINRICKQNNMPITELRGLETLWEADMAYDSKKDDLYVCIKKTNLGKNIKNKYIANHNQLLSSLEKITISKTDNIEFVKDGELELELELESWFDIFKSKIANLLKFNK